MTTETQCDQILMIYQLPKKKKKSYTIPNPCSAQYTLKPQAAECKARLLIWWGKINGPCLKKIVRMKHQPVINRLQDLQSK